jgi:hypothetical protein
MAKRKNQPTKERAAQPKRPPVRWQQRRSLLYAGAGAVVLLAAVVALVLTRGAGQRRVGSDAPDRRALSLAAHRPRRLGEAAAWNP